MESKRCDGVRCHEKPDGNAGQKFLEPSLAESSARKNQPGTQSPAMILASHHSEQCSMRKSFHPGQIVPSTAIYEVTHGPHRLMHRATLMEGDLFPNCRRCHEQVRFALVRPARNPIPVMPSEIFEPSLRAPVADILEFPSRSTEPEPWLDSESSKGYRRRKG